MSKSLENFQFNFTSCLGQDQDVEMTSSSAVSQASGDIPSVQIALGEFRRSSHPRLDIAIPRSVTHEGPSGNQLVLHPSRRRRASRDATPDLDKNSTSSSSGGWRPVRLLAYLIVSVLSDFSPCWLR